MEENPDAKHLAFAAALEELCAAHPLLGNVNNPRKLADIQRVMEAREVLVTSARWGQYMFRLPQYKGSETKLPEAQIRAIHALIYG